MRRIEFGDFKPQRGIAMDATPSRYRAVTGATSLIVGPALMSVGDLFHPAETWGAAAQVAIVADSVFRWYVSHLLLFAGMLLLIPGILALTKVAMDHRPAAGYAARLLMLASVGAFSAVFVFEMLLGCFISVGHDQSAAVVLLEVFQSAEIFVALLPVLLAFFIGTALAVRSLAFPAGPFRWPALGFGLGAILVLGEIILAKVLLSQIGNIICLVAGITFARVLLRGREVAPM
ncbi:MAG TPA: hypothetical protein VHR41_13720 [Gemmatimonadales bacterium]|nr:hypothetical protein [Gemmatimonadales bacterium]